jgi:single-strand DNA-binding protein
MTSLNLCQFIGNVGKIESRYLSNGDQVVNLSLACNDHYKDKNGEKQERTEWVNVAIYGKLAEIADKYVSKGKQIYISGRMQTRPWTDKQGIERYTTNIIATDMKLLGSRPGSGSFESMPDAMPDDAPTNRSAPPARATSGFDDIDIDDLPF